MKPFRKQRAADRDIDEAIAYYLAEAGEAVALGFVDAFDQAMEHVCLHPATGSPRYGGISGIGELRFWTLNRFPYSVFYIERDAGIEVIRVLHQSSDIPVRLQGAES